MAVDPAVFEKLVPIDGLGTDGQRQLAERSKIDEFKSGTVVFEEGSQDPHSYYILEGDIALNSKSTGASRVVSGGTAEARYALANLKPRQFHGKTKSKARMLAVDSELLDKLLAFEQMGGGVEVTEIGGDEADAAWMRRILESPVLLQLPAANLQNLFTSFEEVPMKAGQIIIRQGDRGDYYYVIKQGRCRVVQKPGSDQKMVALADLADGDGFGEEALLSDAPRNATIAALSDGALMRLAKEEFVRLLKEPLVQKVAMSDLAGLVSGGARLLDVRLPSEHQRANLKGSVNLPLAQLRKSMEELDRGIRYIVYCNTGTRSQAAAFLMAERGFDVAVLRDGIQALMKSNPATA